MRNVMPWYKVTLAFSTPVHSNPTPGGSVGLKSNSHAKKSSTGKRVKLEISDIKYSPESRCRAIANSETGYS